MNHDKISVGTYAKNEPASAGLRVLRILYCKKDLICLSIYLFLPSCRSAWNSGGCIISLIIALLTTHRIPENDKPGKRLWLLLLTNVLTISCDSMSCLYRGDESELGIWISQSANIAVYVLMLVFAVEFTYYLHVRLRVRSAVWLYFNEAAAAIGLVLLGVTQFTGFFYFYDIHNNYLRGPGFLCFYGILVIIMGTASTKSISAVTVSSRKTGTAWQLFSACSSFPASFSLRSRPLLLSISAQRSVP